MNNYICCVDIIETLLNRSDFLTKKIEIIKKGLFQLMRNKEEIS